MEIEYPIAVIVGAVICVVMLVLSFVHFKRDKYTGGKKVLTPSYIEDDPYFKRKKIEYMVFSKLVVISCALSIMSASWVIARPYKQVVETQDKYSRDIILCMDISTSVDELNKKLVKELKDLVRELKGERFGIIMFNTSPVLLVPLTDDYDFVLEQLDTIQKGLDARLKYDNWGISGSDTYYYLEFLSGGTLVGAEERGSSLIGDGLGSCVNNFTFDPNRTRIVIFSSDNELYGEPYLSITEAASLCAKRNATVYGIGTREMKSRDMDEMEAACHLTGGEFFLEEDAQTFSTIIDRINAATEHLVSGNKVVHKEDASGPAVLFLLLSTFCMFGFIKLARR